MGIVADNTRRIIKEKAMKQCGVAEKAGFKPKEFSAMLTGKKTIKDYHILPIANALDVTPNDLFSASEPEKSA